MLKFESRYTIWFITINDIPLTKLFMSGTCAKTLFAIIKSALFFFAKSLAKSKSKNSCITLIFFALAYSAKIL